MDTDLPRIPRWIVWTAAATAALLLLAAGLAFWFFGDDRLRNRLERVISAEIGRPVRLDAVLFRVHPRPTLEISGLRVAGPGGPLLEIDRLHLDAEPSTLLQGRVVLGSLRLERPRLRLRVDGRGRGNWEPLPVRSGAAPGGAPTPWSLGGVEIVDGTVDWADARTGTTARVDRLALSAGPVAPGQAFGVALESRVVTDAWTARLSVDTQATLDPGAGDYALRDLALLVDLERSPLAPAPEQLRATAARARYAARANTATVDGLGIEGLGVSARGDIGASGLATAPVAVGTLVLEPFSPRLLLTRLGREPPPMQGPRALGTAALQARFEWRDGELRIPALDASLDDSRLTGTVRVRPGSPSRWRFDLTVDRLDAERYRAPESSRDDDPVQLPLDTLRALDAEGTLRIGELRVAGAWVRGAVFELGAPAAPPRAAAAAPVGPNGGLR